MARPEQKSATKTSARYVCALLSETKQSLLNITTRHIMIRLKLFHRAMRETYDAYPLWLTNIEVFEDSDLDSISVESSENTKKPPSSSPECQFGFGHLTNLPKNAAFPDECLVCSKLLKCFAKKE